MDQLVPDVSFSRKVYFRSHANGNGILQDLVDQNWGGIYRHLNIIKCLNDHLSSIIERASCVYPSPSQLQQCVKSSNSAVGGTKVVYTS